ncbi:hypothetical protein Btru_077651 [Bulinus truncatus]|nr:hypothetical protein Btru_077651 [Bulinus truncatus]
MENGTYPTLQTIGLAADTRPRPPTAAAFCEKWSVYCDNGAEPKMECYQTCVDQGNRCFFSKEKLTCIDCGKYRRGYNVPISRSTNCQHTSCCKCPEVRCECAEVSCLEWFLSLFGLGQKRATKKDTCTSTLAKAGETTAQASETEPLEIAVCRSKEGFSVTLQRIGSKHKCERSSKTSIPFEQNREAEKKFKLDDSFPDHRNTAAVSVAPPTTAAAEDDRKRSGDERHRRKKSRDRSPKWTSSNSSTESRGRSRRKRKKSRSRSGSASKSKEVVHGNKVLSASSSGSRTGKGRSRSCSSSICSCSPIFKPYRHKYSFLKCSSYTPQTSPVHACTSPSAVEPTLGQKYSRAPSKPCPYALPARTLQPSDCSPPREPKPCEPKPCESNAEPQKKKKSGVTQSASMSCGGEAKKCCTRGVAKPTMYPIYNPPCPYFCKLPCRSQSFHTTMVSGPSPRAVCIPNRISCCCPEATCGRSRCRTPKLNGGNRKSRSCPRSCPCPIKASCCSPPPCFKPCCPKPCACIGGGKNCMCCCVAGCKAIPCPPTCTKPCCLPCPRQFQVIPYCPRPTPSDRVYSSLSKCIKGSSCPCPPSSCLCAKPGKSPTRPCCSQLASVNKPLCCTGFTASYIKSKQGDSVCQQLLNKYGFSTVSNKCRPPICTGMTFCPNPCNTNLCKKMTRPGCMCNLPLGPETKSCCAARSAGCRSCRPCASSPGHPSACEPAENYTNSRKPTSPSDKRKQIIQFKNEPCDKPPRCEFYLAPHCLRKTGPRSPVKEYMYKMCIPKKTAREEIVDEAQLPLEVVAEPVADKMKVKEIEDQEVKEDKDIKEGEKLEGAENGETGKEITEDPKKEIGEDAEPAGVSKKRKKRSSKAKSKGKAVTDENASAVSGTLCSEDEEVTHDVMIFYCALSPPATVKESLDEEHLELYKNNNHGCESCVPRHAHFTQSKYYPGFRHESSSYDPHGNNYPLNMSSFLKSRELRPTYDIYRLGTYAGPSFGFSTSCYNRPNDKRTIFDEKLFCTSRLSKNWNVNALNTTKFRTATYKTQRPSNPTVYRNFPKAIICSKLETEIQRKIQQIKIADCKAKSRAWRKQHVDTIPVTVPMMPDTGSQRSKEDEQAVEQENAVGDAYQYKQSQSVRQSEYHHAPRPSYVTSTHPSVRASVYQDAKESLGQSAEQLPEHEEDNKEPETEQKDSCASFVCVTCADNDKDAKQSNCNHDVSSVNGCSNASLPSEETFFRKDILSPEKSAVPAAVPLISSNVKDNDGAGRLQYGMESSVDGAMYEFFQRSATPEEEVADASFLLEDESGNACTKKQQDSLSVDICVTDEETSDEKPETVAAKSDETSEDHNIQTPMNAGEVLERLTGEMISRQETKMVEIKTVEEYQVNGEVSHTSAPSSTVSSSFSSVTMTCSTTISMAARSSIASVSNADLVNVAARDKAGGVVKRISSIRKRPGSNFGVSRGDSPARSCETPIKYLVRNAFVPRDGSDLFLMSESRLRSPYVGSRANSRLHSDAESFLDRPFSGVSETLDTRGRDLLVSGSSVDPVETSGNESQNHRSESNEVLSSGTAETDQLLSSSHAHVTESLVKGTLTIIRAFLKPDEPLACLQMDVNIQGADISIDVVRLYGTPV